MNINFKIFQNSPELKYGISEKSDGSMKINPETKQTLANRAAFFSRLGADKVFSAGLYHEKEVHIGTKRDAGKIVYGVDGLVTNNPGLYLTLTVADCFPVYFFDPKNQIVGIAHAGWRGILAGVIKNTVTQMTLGLNGKSDKFLCGIGPGIQSCHFEIQPDILEQFEKYPKAITHRAGKIFVDLPSIIIYQLKAVGVKVENIESCGECTFCDQRKYFSFRRDKPKTVEAMVAYIGFK